MLITNYLTEKKFFSAYTNTVVWNYFTKSLKEKRRMDGYNHRDYLLVVEENIHHESVTIKNFM